MTSPHAALDRLNDWTRKLIDNIARAGYPPLHSLPIEQARLSYKMAVSVSTVPLVPLPRIENFSIPGPAGPIPARLMAPQAPPPGGGAPLPVLLYLHGGGFVIGSIDTCEAMCRSVAAQSGVAVVAIDYRLAPEHKYPAGLEDAWAATQWLAAHGHTLGLDGSRLAVGGDSAGATLTASVALMARDASQPLRLQAMFYPSVQIGQVTESIQAFSQGLTLNMDTMQWFDAQSRTPGVPDDWRREPLKAASHRGLAPAWIGLAECDPLADDGRLYAQALRAAEVPTELALWPGTVHDFINLGRFLPQAAEAHTALATALRRAMAG